MRTSEKTDQLITALLSVQRRMHAAERNKVNRGINSRYADLDAVWTQLRPLLVEAGLVVIQSNRVTGSVCANVTRVSHVSGQFVEVDGGLEVPQPSKATNKAQDAGKAMTYADRYALRDFFGMAGEDTDAVFGDADDELPEPPAKPEWKDSDRKRFMAKLGDAGLDYYADVVPYFERHPDYGIRPSEMTQAERDRIEAHIPTLAKRIREAA